MQPRSQNPASILPVKFRIQDNYKFCGQNKLDDPLMLGNQWLLEPKSNITRTIISLTNLKTNTSKTIADLMNVVKLLALGENSFAVLSSKRAFANGSYLTIYQIDSNSNLSEALLTGEKLFADIPREIKTEAPIAESIVSVYSLPGNKLVSLVCSSPMDRSKPCYLVISNIENLDKPSTLDCIMFSRELDPRDLQMITVGENLFIKHFSTVYKSTPKTDTVAIFQAMERIKDIFYSKEHETFILGLTDGTIAFLDKEFNASYFPLQESSVAGSDLSHSIYLTPLNDGEHFIAFDSESNQPHIYLWSIKDKTCVDVMELEFSLLKKPIHSFKIHDMVKSSSSSVCVSFTYFRENFQVPDFCFSVFHLGMDKNSRLIASYSSLDAPSQIASLVNGPQAFFSGKHEKDEVDDRQQVNAYRR